MNAMEKWWKERHKRRMKSDEFSIFPFFNSSHCSPVDCHKFSHGKVKSTTRRWLFDALYVDYCVNFRKLLAVLRSRGKPHPLCSFHFNLRTNANNMKHTVE